MRCGGAVLAGGAGVPAALAGVRWRASHCSVALCSSRAAVTTACDTDTPSGYPNNYVTVLAKGNKSILAPIQYKVYSLNAEFNTKIRHLQILYPLVGEFSRKPWVHIISLLVHL